LITLLGGGILFILLGQMKTYGLICLFTYLVSFINEAFRPANSTAIAFYSTEENRTRSYSLNRLAINLGWAVGGAVGGIIAKYNYELLFWVDGITNILAAGLMWFFLKKVDHKKNRQHAETKEPAIPAYRDKVFVIFLVITMLFACCFFQIFTNLPVFFKKDFHLSEPFIGFLMSINGIIIVLIEMVLIYKLEGRRRSSLYITGGMILVALSYFMLHIPAPVAIVAFAMIIVITFGEIFAMPFMNSYWIKRTQTSNRGEYAALYTMAWSAAQVLGPTGGAQVAYHYGFATLWWIVGGLCLLVSVAVYKFL